MKIFGFRPTQASIRPINWSFVLSRVLDAPKKHASDVSSKIRRFVLQASNMRFQTESSWSFHCGQGLSLSAEKIAIEGEVL